MAVPIRGRRRQRQSNLWRPILHWHAFLTAAQPLTLHAALPAIRVAGIVDDIAAVDVYPRIVAESPPGFHHLRF